MSRMMLIQTVLLLLFLFRVSVETSAVTSFLQNVYYVLLQNDSIKQYQIFSGFRRKHFSNNLT